MAIQVPTEVTYAIAPTDGGARLTYAHTGFAGVGGFVLSRLLGRVRRRMLDEALPAVVAELAGDSR